METYFSGRFEEPKKLQTDLEKVTIQKLIDYTCYQEATLGDKEIQINHVPTVLQTHLEEVFASLSNTHTEISFVMQEDWQQFSSCQKTDFNCYEFILIHSRRNLPQGLPNPRVTTMLFRIPPH